MASETKKGLQTVNPVSLVSPSTLETKRGIKIGSSMDEVILKYGKEREIEQVTPDEAFIAGSVYGGLLFTFTNGYVSKIFLGAMAE